MNNKFGEKIKELRIENNLSVLKLGKAIGVSDATICRWENGKSDIKSADLLKLAKFFNVSIDYLLSEDN